MQRPIPTLRGTPTHATAVELYQRHQVTAARTCARCGGPTPCEVRSFAASVIAAAGDDPLWYDTRSALSAPAASAANEPRHPDPAHSNNPELIQARTEPFGYSVGWRDLSPDAEGLLYEREH
ncbi:hypothetical protein EDC02_6686 [Micromonospora sp. Llam0]|nr:hypothetical protein EDC02_6686 [Micromonospora sp. Llam0]